VNGPDPGDPSQLTVSSLDLPAGTVPREFTCDGANRRPRLGWSTPPPGTRELAIEMLDPDAPGGTFTHWLVYGLPPGVSSLAAVPAAQGWKAGPGRRVTVRGVVACLRGGWSCRRER
jgi:phosphatidylethanolamine-binding protein (PEBP) family uncharacterized protein